MQHHETSYDQATGNFTEMLPESPKPAGSAPAPTPLLWSKSGFNIFNARDLRELDAKHNKTTADKQRRNALWIGQQLTLLSKEDQHDALPLVVAALPDLKMPTAATIIGSKLVTLADNESFNQVWEFLRLKEMAIGEERLGKISGAPRSLKSLAESTASYSDNEETEEELSSPRVSDGDDTGDEYVPSETGEIADAQEEASDALMANAKGGEDAVFEEAVQNSNSRGNRKRRASTTESPRGNKRLRTQNEPPLIAENSANPRSRLDKPYFYFRKLDAVDWAVAAAEYDNFDRLEDEDSSPQGDSLEFEVQTYFLTAPGGDVGDLWIPEEPAAELCTQDTYVNHHNGVHVEVDVEVSKTAETPEMHANRQALADEFSEGLYNPWIDVDDEYFVPDAVDPDDEDFSESEGEEDEMTVVSLREQADFWLLEEEKTAGPQDDINVKRSPTDFTTYVAADQDFSQDNQPPELGMIEPDPLVAVDNKGKPFPKRPILHFSAVFVRSSSNGDILEDVPDTPFQIGNGILGTTMMRYASRGLTMAQHVARLSPIYHRGPEYFIQDPKTGTLSDKVKNSFGKWKSKDRGRKVYKANPAGTSAVNFDMQRARNALSMRIQRARDREGGLPQGVPGHTKRTGGVTKNEKEVYGRPAVSLGKSGQPNGLLTMTDEMILFGTIWPVDLKKGTFKQPPTHPTHKELKDGKSNWQNQPFELSMPEDPTPRVLDILDAIGRPYPSIYDFMRGEGVFDGRGPADLSSFLERAEIAKLIAVPPLARTHELKFAKSDEAWVAVRREGVAPKRPRKKLAGRVPKAKTATRLRDQVQAKKRKRGEEVGAKVKMEGMDDVDGTDGIVDELSRSSIHGGVVLDPGSSYPNLAHHADAGNSNLTSNYSIRQSAIALGNTQSDAHMDTASKDNEHAAPVQQGQQAAEWDSDWSEEE